MIYKKDANFPYPVLNNTSLSYEESEFELDVTLQENSDSYRFHLSYKLDSGFIKELLVNKQAQLILVIQSKDNKFFNLKLDQQYIEIPKTRIALSKRTVVQILIQAREEVRFTNNKELSSFYKDFKDDIIVPSHALLGYSNLVVFEGSNKEPLELFEKKLTPTLKSDIKIELGSETIIINYKNEALQFIDSPMSTTLNNPYIYMGLQKALYRFIINNDNEGEAVILDEINVPDNGLDFKLYNLMKNKFIREINLENIDEVISLISDKILEKNAIAIKGLYRDGN